MEQLGQAERKQIQMATLTGGKAVVEWLRAEGTQHVFGLIGSAGMEIVDALYDPNALF